MSDKKPEKVVEASPFEKWWAEVMEWREKRQGTKLQKAEQFHTPRPIRRNQSRFFVAEEEEESSRNKKKSVINISGMVLFGLVEVVLGLIGIVFRFAFWIAIVGGLLWALTTFDVKTVVKDKAVDEVKKEAAEIKGEVGDVFQDIADELNEFAKNWSIEIRQTTEDGKEVKVLEIGTEISTKKDDTPPEKTE